MNEISLLQVYELKFKPSTSSMFMVDGTTTISSEITDNPDKADAILVDTHIAFFIYLFKDNNWYKCQDIRPLAPGWERSTIHGRISIIYKDDLIRYLNSIITRNVEKEVLDIPASDNDGSYS